MTLSHMVTITIVRSHSNIFHLMAVTIMKNVGIGLTYKEGRCLIRRILVATLLVVDKDGLEWCNGAQYGKAAVVGRERRFIFFIFIFCFGCLLS
jgi:hypothetical protein